MQVFVIGTPLETAKCLDKKRLHKQIVECGQILAALEGKTTAWKNHPCVTQYRGHETWLRLYRAVLINYGKDNAIAEKLNEQAVKLTPKFHGKDYLNQMKRRLYTKDKEHYWQFSEFGESHVNWYWDNNTKTYLMYYNGKRISETNIG